MSKERGGLSPTSAGLGDGAMMRPVPAGSGPVLLLDCEGVARALSVSVREVFRMRARGELPDPIKMGEKVRWSAAALAERVRQWEHTGGPKKEAVERVYDR